MFYIISIFKLIMEYTRNQVYKNGNLVLFIGILLSDCLILPAISKRYLHLPQLFISIGLIISFILSIISIGLFYVTAKPLKLLQFIEYILLPVIAFLEMQTYEHETQLARLVSYPDFWMSQLCFYFTAALIVWKILFIPQRFISHQDWSIISVSTFYRLFRVVKMVLINIAFKWLGQSIALIVLSVATLIYAIIVTKYYSYQNLFHEMITFLGCLASIFSTFSWIVNYYLDINYLFICEVIVFIIYINYNKFSLPTKLLEKKFNYLILSTRKMDEFYQKVIVLQTIKDIKLTKPSIFCWSHSFQQKLQFFFLELLIEHQQEKNLYKSSRSHLFHESDYYKNLENETVLYKLAENLFFAEIHHIMKFQEVDFFAFLTAGKSKRLTNLCLIKYCKLLQHSKNVFFLKKFLENMLRDYINYYINLYQEKNQQEQSVIQFQNKIIQFRNSLTHACNKEIKLIESLSAKNHQQNVQLNSFVKRYWIKKSLQNKIESYLSTKYYFCFSDFIYVFLLYSLIFCKTISKTKIRLRDNFIIPLKSNSMQLKQVVNMSIVVSSAGINSKDKGIIVNSNCKFRQNYLSKLNKNKVKISNISQFIPVEFQSDHNQAIARYLTFNKQKQSDHSKYQCFIVNYTNTKQLYKKVIISVKPYYSFKSDFYFISRFEDDGEQFFVKKQQEENIMEVNQLQLPQYKMTLIPYTHLQSVEIDDIDSLKSLHSEDKDNSIVQIEEDKFAKIQNQIPKHNQEAKKVMKIIIFATITFLFVFGVVITFNILSGVFIEDQISGYVKFEKNIFKHFVHNQEKAIFLIALLEVVKDNQIPRDYCSEFAIQNLEQYIMNLLNDMVSESYDQIESNFHLYPNDLQKILIERKYFYFEMEHQGLKISLKKYQSLFKSFIYEWKQTDFQNLEGQKKQYYISRLQRLIVKGIKYANQPISDITSFIDDKIQKQKQIEMSFMISKIVVILLWVILFAYLYIKAHKQIIKLLQLTNSLDEKFANKRINQCEYIIKKLEEEQLYVNRNVYLKSSEIIVIDQRGTQQEMELEQFQDLCKFARTRKYKTTSKQLSLNFVKNKSEIKWYQSVLEKKMFLIGFIIIFSLLTTTQINLSNLHLEEIDYINKFSKYEQNIRYYEHHMYTMLNSVWLGFVDQAFQTPQQLEDQFQSSLDFIRQKQIRVLTMAQYSPTFSSNILHSSICGLQTDKVLENQCLIFQGGLMTFGIAELIPQYYKNLVILKSIQKNDHSWNSSRTQSFFCRSIVMAYNFTSLAFTNLHDEGYKQIQLTFSFHRQILWILAGIFSVLFLIFLSYNLWRFYWNTRIVKQQILTLDKPEGLYKYEQFHPHLNKLIYTY